MDRMYRWILIYDEAGTIVDLNFVTALIFIIAVYSAWLFVDKFLGVMDDDSTGASLLFAAIATIITILVLFVVFGAISMLGRWVFLLLVPIIASELGKLLRKVIK